MYLKRPCGFCTRTQKRRSSFFLFIEPAFQKQISMNPRRARRHRFENARAHLLVERTERIYWENFFRISYFEEIYSLLTLSFLHFPKKLIPTREETTISRFKQQQRMRVCALIRDGASINRINRYGARQTSQVSGRFSIPGKMGRALKSRNPGWRFIIEADRSLSKRPFPWKLWRVGERNNKSSSKPKLPSNDPARATTVGIKGPEITIARLFSYRDPSAAQAVGPFEYGRDRPCGISGPKLNASRVTISELLLNRHRSPSNGSSLIWKKKKNRGETLFHFWNRWYSTG